MTHSQRIVVLYDSITNSVFISQVLSPLQTWLAADKHRTALLISFEAVDTTHHPARAYIALEKQITLIIYTRIPFFGIPSLWYAVYCIKKIITANTDALVIARGPLAGYVCLSARAQATLPALIIQIRGLLSHEYAYAYQTIQTIRFPYIQTWWYQLRLFLYRRLETTVYKKKDALGVLYEAVSPALREYLIKTHTLNPETTTISCDDIPQPIAPQKRKQWRVKMRATLGIPDDAHVYCYNGSVKPWQLPPLFFTFCRDMIAPNPKAHLLVISQDHEQCKRLLPTTNIPADRCHLISQEQPHMIYHYLAAADTGLAFRDATLLNWVSRPTKLLEYQAVGLRILHNGTIAWIAESARNQQRYSSPVSVAVAAQKHERVQDTL